MLLSSAAVRVSSADCGSIGVASSTSVSHGDCIDWLAEVSLRQQRANGEVPFGGRVVLARDSVQVVVLHHHHQVVKLLDAAKDLLVIESLCIDQILQCLEPRALSVLHILTQLRHFVLCNLKRAQSQDGRCVTLNSEIQLRCIE